MKDFSTGRGELSPGLALGFTSPTFTTPNPKRGWGQVRVSGRTRHSNALASTQGHVNKEITDDKRSPWPCAFFSYVENLTFLDENNSDLRQFYLEA